MNDLDFSKSLLLVEDVLAIEPKPSNVEPWHWKLYFDGATNNTRNEVKAILVSPKSQ